MQSPSPQHDFTLVGGDNASDAVDDDCCNNCRGFVVTLENAACTRCCTPMPASSVDKLCARCALKINRCRRCAHSNSKETVEIVDPVADGGANVGLPTKFKYMINVCTNCDELPLVASRNKAQCEQCAKPMRTCTYRVCAACSAVHDVCSVCTTALVFRR